MEVLLFFHQAPQVEKESGAEGEDIEHSQTTLDNSINCIMIIVNFTLLTMVLFLLPRS